jgi:hypothetical protein
LPNLLANDNNTAIDFTGIDLNIMIVIDNFAFYYKTEERIMKKISYLLAGLLCLSTSVFAEDHLAEATKHANEAVSEGHAGSAPKMMHHAKAALDHALAASIVAKSVPKNHINAASKSLQESIDQSSLNQVEGATKSAETAVEHLNAAKK